MAEENPEEVDPGEGEENAGAGRKKKLLFILLPVLIVVGIAMGVYFSGVMDSMVQEEKSAGEGEKGPQTQQTVFHDLPEILVNLNTRSNREAYLKVRVSLELSDPSDLSRVEEVMPRVLDSFQLYLRELRPEDLEGASGIYRLKEELLARVNRAVHPAEVADVLFREMLVQ